MKSMKKITLGTAVVLCSLALVGCGKKVEKKDQHETSSSQVEKSSSSLESSKKQGDEKTSKSATKETNGKTSESTTKKNK